MFDSALAHVLNLTSNKGSRVFSDEKLPRLTITTKEDSVIHLLAFFDNFFKGMHMVLFRAAFKYFIILLLSLIDQGQRVYCETSPNTTGEYANSFVIRMRWRDLYEKFYLPSAAARKFKAIRYPEFTAIRKARRPNYRRSRKVSMRTGFTCI